MRSPKGSEGIYIFAKLKGFENYKKWAWEIGFALLDAGLIAYADGRSSKPEPYTKIAILSKEGSALLTEKKIEKQETEIEKWIFNNARTCGKIGRIYTRSV